MDITELHLIAQKFNYFSFLDVGRVKLFLEQRHILKLIRNMISMCTLSDLLFPSMIAMLIISFVTEWRSKALSRSRICKFRVNFRVKFSRNSIN